jgi:aspartate/methionine/tyrosine aminotransferase
MSLNPFALDQWLERFKDAPAHDLGTSTGPSHTLADLGEDLELAWKNARERPLTYGHADGGREVREAVARLHDGVRPEDVIVTFGASEALHTLYASLAEPGRNVVVPFPAFTPILEIPRALGLEVRPYHLRPEHGFRVDPQEVAGLVDDRTALVLACSPHNPTGAVLGGGELAELARIAEARDVTLVCDEVYWPIFHGESRASGARLPRAVVVGSLSKAASVAGLRLGWIIDRVPERRARALNARMYFTISHSPLLEVMGALVLAHSPRLVETTRRRAADNLALLDRFVAANGDRIRWVRPAGGTTAFPWFPHVPDTRPLCESLARAGVLVVPGDCFGRPQHVRVGFGAAPRMAEALDVFGKVLRG